MEWKILLLCVFMETVRIFCGLNKFLAWFHAHRRNLYFYDLAFLKCMRWKSRPCIIWLYFLSLSHVSVCLLHLARSIYVNLLGIYWCARDIDSIFVFIETCPFETRDFSYHQEIRKMTVKRKWRRAFYIWNDSFVIFLPFISYRKSQQRLLVIISLRRINKCVHFLKPSMLFLCPPKAWWWRPQFFLYKGIIPNLWNIFSHYLDIYKFFIAKTCFIDRD